MLLIAIGNGALREFVFKKFMTALAAHQLSTVNLFIFFALYIAFIINRFPPGSSNQAVFIGFLWLVLTLVFEFGFGRYRGNSWSKLFEDYNLLKGRIWILIPVWLFIAPYIFYKLRS